MYEHQQRLPFVTWRMWGSSGEGDTLRLKHTGQTLTQNQLLCSHPKTPPPTGGGARLVPHAILPQSDLTTQAVMLTLLSCHAIIPLRPVVML